MLSQAYTTPSGDYYVAADGVPMSPLDTPCAVTPDSVLWKEHVAEAQALLERSDTTILRCVERGVPVPQEWADYRAELRAIVGEKVVGDPTDPMPIRPAYPVA